MPASLNNYFSEVEARFAAAADFTIGLEEEFQLLDPATLALASRYEELRAAASGELANAVAGELISCEIEIKTDRCENFSEAARQLVVWPLALAFWRRLSRRWPSCPARP